MNKLKKDFFTSVDAFREKQRQEEKYRYIKWYDLIGKKEIYRKKIRGSTRYLKFIGIKKSGLE